MTETRLAEIGRLRSDKHRLEEAARDAASVIDRLTRHHDGGLSMCEGKERCYDLDMEARETARHLRELAPRSPTPSAPRPIQRGRRREPAGGA